MHIKIRPPKDIRVLETELINILTKKRVKRR